MKDAILVTGAAGLLGGEIIKQLAERKYPAIGTDLVAGSRVDRVLDVTDEGAVNQLMRNVTAVIHTAALHGRHMDLQIPRKNFVHTNVLGTLNLLSSAVRQGLQKFIYTSSTSIYGDAMVDPRKAVWIDEQLIPQPRDIYDITKQTAEALCKDFSFTDGIPVTVLRVSRFMKESANDIANYRLYRGVDVRDAARGHIQALQSSLGGFKVFNISSKSPFNPHDLQQIKRSPLKIISSYYPQAAAIYRRLKWTFPASIDRVYDISKAQQLLAYEPKYNFEDYLIEEDNLAGTA